MVKFQFVTMQSPGVYAYQPKKIDNKKLLILELESYSIPYQILGRDSTIYIRLKDFNNADMIFSISESYNKKIKQ